MMKYTMIASLYSTIAAIIFTASPTIAADQDKKSALLTNCYEMSNDKVAGTPVFHVNLSVHVSHNFVTGVGNISFPSQAPSIATKLDGSYVGILVNDHINEIILTATGYPPIGQLKLPLLFGPSPAILPNVDLQMVLDKNLKSGTASYKYNTGNNRWTSINNVPVKSILCNTNTDKKTPPPPTGKSSGILLNEHFPNLLQVGGESAWFIKENNTSTGYSWSYIPDNSGVYELTQEIVLHPSLVGAVGVPGARIWQFKAVRPGQGAILFALNPPGGSKPIKTIKVLIQASANEAPPKEPSVAKNTSSGILLTRHFPNTVPVGDELAWYMVTDNPSTGYSWGYIPDNSGIYELIEEIFLPASTQAEGVPGKRIWKFKTVRPGTGAMLFELYPPGGKKPAKIVKVVLKAVEK